MTENPFKNEDREHEWRLQEATATYLTGKLYGGPKVIKTYPIPFHYLKFHHPALEYRGAESGNKYKKRGSTSGIFDWLFWGPDRFHAMAELKVAKRGLNIPQKETWRWLGEYGFPKTICYSVKELRDFIISCGFECHNMACIEPDYRSPEKKKFDAFEFYKP